MTRSQSIFKTMPLNSEVLLMKFLTHINGEYMSISQQLRVALFGMQEVGFKTARNMKLIELHTIFCKLTKMICGSELHLIDGILSRVTYSSNL